MDANTQKLIEHFGGSRAKVASHFNVTRETVRQWVESGIPPGRALEAEEVTFGKVKALDVLKSYRAQQKAAA